MEHKKLNASDGGECAGAGAKPKPQGRRRDVYDATASESSSMERCQVIRTYRK
ncbi:hypothetical protein [Porphyromonas endodontalis]|uniref:hypothetical protein n=1 Tax=Porphyromonas endodontalis TaxID=28124 RepID=UPI0028E2A31A|nr:hypothetical protein [Porphyromonas endodontalis]